MHTYCGKDCENCIHKEKLACPGCKNGPGKFYYGDCEIAKCCGRKGYINCKGCTYNTDCITLRNCKQIPEWRYNDITAEADRETNMTINAPFIGKWLWLLFWLIIPSFIAGIMSNENIVSLFPELHVPGEILSCICIGLYGYFLLKLSTVEKYYRTSGICCLFSAAINVVVVFIPNHDSVLWIALVFAIPTTIISLYGEYHEYMGHTEILIDCDKILSRKWNTLWKWYIGTYACIFGSIIVVLINPILGMLVLLAGLIGLSVVSIMKLVYLYKTAKIFREYS